jgi:hypothetical protein
MKKILAASICVLMLFGCATTTPNAVTLTVTGIGATPEEARRNGFRDAIQLAYGSLNLSERRVINDRLFEEDVSYARGVIESFQEIERRIDDKDKQHQIRMSVTVSPTAVERRLLAVQDSSKVNGSEISRQLDIGRQQLRSEADRHMAARRLFEHITRNFAEGLFDIKAGELKTIRDGAKIAAVVDINHSLSAKSLDSLCIAAKNYRDSRSSSVPEQYGRSSALFKIHHAYGCSVEAEVESGLMQSMVQSLSSLGICIALEDAGGKPLRKLFYPSNVAKLVSPVVLYSSSNIPTPGAYLTRGFTVSRQTSPSGGRRYIDYDTAIVLSRYLGGNNRTQRLILPTLPDQELHLLSKVTASLSGPANCTGSRDLVFEDQLKGQGQVGRDSSRRRGTGTSTRGPQDSTMR